MPRLRRHSMRRSLMGGNNIDDFLMRVLPESTTESLQSQLRNMAEPDKLYACIFFRHFFGDVLLYHPKHKTIEYSDDNETYNFCRNLSENAMLFYNDANAYYKKVMRTDLDEKERLLLMKLKSVAKIVRDEIYVNRYAFAYNSGSGWSVPKQSLIKTFWDLCKLAKKINYADRLTDMLDAYEDMIYNYNLENFKEAEMEALSQLNLLQTGMRRFIKLGTKAVSEPAIYDYTRDKGEVYSTFRAPS